MAQQSADKQLPVFVFPSSVTFYTYDQSSYKQILTLYNPYDFKLRFKVLSTAPHKYSVIDSEGVIKSRCCVDVVIRHNEVCTSNEGLRDKFRVSMQDYNTRRTLGFKDIVASLLPRKEALTEDRFESLPEIRTTPPPLQQNFTPVVNPSKANFVMVIVAILCILVLLLPIEEEKSSLPSYLRVSVNQKLVASYVLGLLTMVVMKT